MKKTLIGLALLAALFVLFFHEIFFFGRSLAGLGCTATITPRGACEDLAGGSPKRLMQDTGGYAWHMYPNPFVTSRMLRAGTLPLWNPHTGLGAPYAADLQSGVWSPVQLPLNLLPSFTAWEIFIVGRLFLLGLLIYWLLGWWEMGLPARLGGAFAAVGSGAFILAPTHVENNVYVLVPLLLLTLDNSLYQRSFRSVALFGLVAGFCMLGGNPQAAVVVFLCVLFTGCGASLIEAARVEKPLRRFSSSLAIIGGGFILGALVSGIVIVPALEYMKFSMATHGESTALIAISRKSIVTWVMPYLRQAQSTPFIDMASRRFGLNFCYYSGSVVFVLMLLALFGARTPARSDRRGDRFLIYIWPLAIFFTLLLVKSYGVWRMRWVAKLPMLSLINYGKYGPFLLAILAAILAGMGIESLSRRRLSAGGAVAASVLALLGVLSLYAWRYPALRTDGLLSHSLVPLALSCGGIAALAAWVLIAGRRFTPRAAAWGAFAVLFLQLAILNPPKNPRRDLWPPSPLKQELEALDRSAPFRMVATDAFLYPNTLSAFGMDDIRMLNAFYPARYMELCERVFTSPRKGVHIRFTGTESDLKKDLDKKLRIMKYFNVKYAVIPEFFDTPPARMAAAAEVLSGKKPGVRYYGRAPALSLPPPARFRSPVSVPAEATAVKADCVIGYWGRERSDGVGFRVALHDGRRKIAEESVFVPGGKNYRKGEIELSLSGAGDAPAGERRDLILDVATDAGPRGDRSYDEALLANIRWVMPGGVEARAPVRKYIKELPGALDRAYLVHRAEVLPKEEILGILEKGEIDLSTTALIEELLPAGFALAEPSAGESESVSIVDYSPNAVTIRVTAAANALLVLSDCYFPGWECAVDGERAKILCADYAVRAVPISAGEHTVRFTYRPRSFRWGAGLTLLGLAIIIGGLVFGGGRMTNQRPESD